MWIIDPTTQTETRVNIIEIVNPDTQEILTVATKDAKRILRLIQERFVRTIANGKVYIIDTDDKLVGIPTNLEADELTIEDKKHIQAWLDYLNRDDNNDNSEEDMTMTNQMEIILHDDFGRVQTGIKTEYSAPQLMDKILEMVGETDD